MKIVVEFFVTQMTITAVEFSVRIQTVDHIHHIESLPELYLDVAAEKIECTPFYLLEVSEDQVYALTPYQTQYFALNSC